MPIALETVYELRRPSQQVQLPEFRPLARPPPGTMPLHTLSGAASPAEGARLHVGPVALAAAGARRGLSSVVQLHCIIGGLDFFRGYPETRGLVITSWICADIEDLCGEF